MFQLSRSVKRLIAMFVDQSDRASIEAAVDAGVSAYVVDGLRQERAGLSRAFRRYPAQAPARRRTFPESRSRSPHWPA